MSYLYLDDSGSASIESGTQSISLGDSITWEEIGQVISSNTFASLGSSSSSSSSTIPVSVQKDASEYAQDEWDYNYEIESAINQAKGEDLATAAYIAYQKQLQSLPAQMAQQGYTGSLSTYQSSALSDYQSAIASIKSQMEEWDTSLQSSLDSQYSKDEATYISDWKDSVGW